MPIYGGTQTSRHRLDPARLDGSRWGSACLAARSVVTAVYIVVHSFHLLYSYSDHGA
jgi:hypothetical protein